MMYTKQQAINAGYGANFSFCSDPEFSKGTYEDIMDVTRTEEKGNKIKKILIQTETARYNPETKKMDLKIEKKNKILFEYNKKV